MSFIERLLKIQNRGVLPHELVSLPFHIAYMDRYFVAWFVYSVEALPKNQGNEVWIHRAYLYNTDLVGIEYRLSESHVVSGFSNAVGFTIEFGDYWTDFERFLFDGASASLSMLLEHCEYQELLPTYKSVAAKLKRHLGIIDE